MEGGGGPGTETWKEKTCPRDSRVMFLRHVGICACFAGEEGQKTLGPFSNLKVFFFQGLEDTFSCVLLLKAYSTSLLLAVCSCHSKHTHTSAADTSERLRLSPVSA